jgi:hypothetical protein
MKRALLALLAIVGTAVALEYRVDPRGGPLELGVQVAAAFAGWQAASEDKFDVREADGAGVLFRYGDPARFGPDTVSLTVSRSGPEGRSSEVLLNQDQAAYIPRALLFETGLLLGLPPSGEGAMNPALTTREAELSEADIAEALAQQQFHPADLNRDGVVDFYDLIILAREFGRSGVGLTADINRDGVVDEADLALLKEAYTFAEPSETPPGQVAPAPLAPPTLGDLEGAGEDEAPSAARDDAAQDEEAGEAPAEPEEGE